MIMKTQIRSSLKSLFKVSLLAILMLTFSCTQDQVNDIPENLNVQAAKGKTGKAVTRPIKAKLSNAPNTGGILPNEDCGFPVNANDIFGNMSHLGKIRPESYGVPTSCIFLDPSNVLYPGQFALITTYDVNYNGGNGHSIVTEEFTTIVFDDDTFVTGIFVGHVVIDPDASTGKFAGATGTMVFMNASFDGDESTWELEGEITYQQHLNRLQ